MYRQVRFALNLYTHYEFKIRKVEKKTISLLINVTYCTVVYLLAILCLLLNALNLVSTVYFSLCLCVVELLPFLSQRTHY